ncbi:hypothetical protein L208DRAFT_1510463 [Tricholoma matsutake]|nr:hypothetical protein L208DRAFT_1510463 [Tricholoma matsutake 945]
MVTLDLPASSKMYPKFHMSEVFRHNENDGELFPSRELTRLGGVVTEDGQKEFFMEKIMDAQKRGRGMQYLVHWLSYGQEDEWLTGSELANNAVLNEWLAGNG